MPHVPIIKSAIKRAEIAIKRREANMAKRSALRTALKKATVAITGNADNSRVTYQEAMKALDKAVTNGTIHKNQASRRKSRLAKKLNALGK